MERCRTGAERTVGPLSLSETAAKTGSIWSRYTGDVGERQMGRQMLYGIQQHDMPSSKHNNAVSARLICELQISRLQWLVQVHFRRALAGVTLCRTAEQHSSVIVRLRMLQEIHDENDIINGEQPAFLRTWF